MCIFRVSITKFLSFFLIFYHNCTPGPPFPFCLQPRTSFKHDTVICSGLASSRVFMCALFQQLLLSYLNSYLKILYYNLLITLLAKIVGKPKIKSPLVNRNKRIIVKDFPVCINKDLSTKVVKYLLRTFKCFFLEFYKLSCIFVKYCPTMCGAVFQHLLTDFIFLVSPKIYSYYNFLI